MLADGLPDRPALLTLLAGVMFEHFGLWITIVQRNRRRIDPVLEGRQAVLLSVASGPPVPLAVLLGSHDFEVGYLDAVPDAA